jgi:DNA polymerase-3 subunit delta'
MVWPGLEASLHWLEQQGLSPEQALILLRAAGGRPADALQWAQSGRDAQAWRKLPGAMLRGEVTVFKDWPPAQVLDALHKLCHDVLAQHTGACPRFFEAADLPATGTLASLTAWAHALSAAAKSVEHPFNSGLMLEALVSQAQIALNSGH